MRDGACIGCNNAFAVVKYFYFITYSPFSSTVVLSLVKSFHRPEQYCRKSNVLSGEMDERA